MKLIKAYFKTKTAKAITISGSILIALLLIASIVLVNVPFLYNTVNSVLGDERRVLKSGDPNSPELQYYKSDYDSKAETLAAANALNEEICEEGIILLKNDDENPALPLAAGSKISVFGKGSANLILGGSGSNAGSGANQTADLYSSLTDAGFIINSTMQNFFKSSQSGSGRPATPGMTTILTGYPIAETPVASYTEAVKSSYSDFNDVALVVLGRIGGEGYDLPRTMFWNGRDYKTWSGNDLIPGARSKTDHYLQLDQNETDMLKEACDNFDKVVVVINCSTPMELGFLDDPTHYAYNSNIKAALWIGNPGGSGIKALGRVLSGEVNPSGKTVDTYARDFKTDPTWNNFGNNLKADGNRYTLDGKSRNAYFVEYEEGIYVGYRYWETRAFLEAENENAGWYNQNVVYPFGYGKSYTKFDWTVSDWKKENDKLSVNVTVENTGNVAGKDVVQLYYTAPYYDGEIEKAHVVLGDFIKTDLLPANAGAASKKTYKLELNIRDMASYDNLDANGNGFVGYELDAGDYELRVMRDSHTQVGSNTFTLEAKRYDTDAATGTKIENLFNDVSNYIAGRGGYLSRSDFEATWPKVMTADDLKATQQLINALSYSVNDTASDPWYSETKPKQKKNTLSYNRTAVKLHQLIGKDYDDELWDELLDQLTIEQMIELITIGNYRTKSVSNIQKPGTIDADGPMGFAIFMGDPSVYDTCYYASECVMAATWNTELAMRMGEMVGNEGVIGNKAGDGRPYSGWYAPAVNIHRSQFGGRNFEYYSEDSLLSGKMAVSVVKGANSKGVYTYVKHFALNDQETNRDTTGLITWASEQAMREFYFVPFEMAVKEGGATAMMSSFNRMGTTWAGGDYNLLTRLLRDEWGFRGMVITDFNLTPYMNLDQMIRAGGDLNLSPGKNLADISSNTSKTVIRKSAKNILFTVVNSNAMNGSGANVVWKYLMPQWFTWLCLGITGVFVLFCGAEVLAFCLKRNKLIAATAAVK